MNYLTIERKDIENAYHELVNSCKEACESGKPLTLEMKSGKRTPIIYISKRGSINFSETESITTSMRTVLRIFEDYPTFDCFKNNAKPDRSQPVGNYNSYHWAVVNWIWEKLPHSMNYNSSAIQAVFHVDYLEIAKRRKILGTEGEKWVVEYEKDRLKKGKRIDLADKVKHVALENGDGLGYDVLSFNDDGSERYIEVKTTCNGLKEPFYVTSNELEKSNTLNNYYLYRVYNFNKEKNTAKIKIIPGGLNNIKLEPTEYKASIKK